MYLLAEFEQKWASALNIQKRVKFIPKLLDFFWCRLLCTQLERLSRVGKRDGSSCRRFRT